MEPSSAPQSASGRRFSLVRTLGEGTFGTVYLAEMEGAGGFKRRVALKILNQTWEPGSDAARRLRDEARILGRLDHRNIVRVDDLVLLDGRWGLVMEFVDGADIERVYAWCARAGRHMPARALAQLGAAVATALQAAYVAPGENGAPLHVVHRDIKPSNVHLTDGGEVKVLDFGVARAAFSGREARTERVRYGSLGYMAPERLLGEHDTPAGDIYALGVMLYECATGELFGRAELGMDKQAEQVAAAREKLVARVGEIALVPIIEGALGYAPESRPSAAELAETLQLTADTLPGEDLARFARAVIPNLPPPATDSVRGRILQELVARTGDPLGRPGDTWPRVSSATIAVDPLEPGPANTARRRPVAVVAGGIAIFLALLVGVYVSANLGETETSPVPSPAAPAPTPPAQPPPAQPPPAQPVPLDPAPGPAAALPAVAPRPTPAAGAPRAAPSTRVSSPPPIPTADAGTPPASAAPRAADAGTSRLRAAKFTLTGAEGIQVTCGDVSGSGTTSTLLRELPAGDCTVAAGGLTTRVRLDSPRGVACAVEGETLTCR